MNKYLVRLISTTKLIKKPLKIDINDKKINEIFKEELKKKYECCEKCDEVKKIVKPKFTFKMEQD